MYLYTKVVIEKIVNIELFPQNPSPVFWQTKFCPYDMKYTRYSEGNKLAGFSFQIFSRGGNGPPPQGRDSRGGLSPEGGEWRVIRSRQTN